MVSSPRHDPISVPDRQIDLVAFEVDHARRRYQLQVDLRLGAFEGAELRNQPRGGQRRRQGEPHDAAPGGRENGFCRRLDLAQRGFDLFEITPARVGQPGPRAGPIDQFDAEVRLEAFHLMADRRFRDAEAFRRVAKPIIGRGGMERAKRRERRQRDFAVGHRQNMHRV